MGNELYTLIAKDPQNLTTEALDMAIEKAYAEMQKYVKSEEKINNYMLAIAYELYKLSDKVEELNLVADIAKTKSKEEYHKKYLSLDGTIQQRQAACEIHTVNQQMQVSITQAMVKTLRNKLEYGKEILSALRRTSDSMSNDKYMIKDKVPSTITEF